MKISNIFEEIKNLKAGVVDTDAISEEPTSQPASISRWGCTAWRDPDAQTYMSISGKGAQAGL